MVSCCNCDGTGEVKNKYFPQRVVCPYCLGTGQFAKPDINHRQWRAGPWGYWRSWSIHCLRCDKMLDYRNATQPDKCPSCGYGGDT